MPGLRPNRHRFERVTTTAKKWLEAETMRGAKFIVVQADPDNTDDVLLDTLEAMDKSFTLCPADIIGISAPESASGPPFGQGKGREDWWIEFDVYLQSVTGTQAVTVWVFKPVGG